MGSAAKRILVALWVVVFGLETASASLPRASETRHAELDESDGFYLPTVCDYVHLNPARAGLLESELAKAGIGAEDLPLLKKGHPMKVRIANVLRGTPR